MNTDSPRVLVVIPTYDEIDNLAPIIARLRRAVPDAEALVVDDSSPDGTGDLADQLRRTDDHLHVLHRPGKGGLGAAYLAGFEWGLRRGFDVLVEMDADGSHAPEELSRLLGLLETCDVVLGSRYVAGGRVRNWPRRRQFLSRAGNLYVRVALGTRLRDATGGYRAYRREVLEHIIRTPPASAGYCFQIDLAWRAERAGFAVAETPITFTERQVGASKMTGDIVTEALARTTRWGIASRAGQLGRLLGARRRTDVPERPQLSARTRVPAIGAHT